MEKDQRNDGVMPAGRQELRKTGHRAFEAGEGCRIAGISRHDGIPWRDGVCHGLYIGDNIRLYYNAPGEKGTPACVLTAEIRVDDANGPLLCDLLSFKGFNLKSMENFCLRRYNLVRTGGSFLQWTEDFLSGSTGTGNVAGLLREKFMAEGFEESLVREELDKLGLRVSYKEGHAAITLRYPE